MTTRRTRIEFNFDGLTDSITNLVGSLILLVTLVITMTRPRTAGVDESPPPDNVVGAEHPVDQLLDRLRSMKAEVSDVDQTMQRIELRLSEFADELQHLRESTATEPR